MKGRFVVSPVVCSKTVEICCYQVMIRAHSERFICFVELCASAFPPAFSILKWKLFQHHLKLGCLLEYFHSASRNTGVSITVLGNTYLQKIGIDFPRGGVLKCSEEVADVHG